MKTSKAIVTCLMALSMLAVQDVCAQDTKEREATDVSQRGWYVGVEGGVPFGVNTLSSFGSDKTRAGYAAGLFGGYRFSSVISAELSAKLGKTNLSGRECCVASDYWLGVDGLTYHAPVAGMLGADYSDLKSVVSLQQYGARLNVNLLGFFNRTKQSRWRLELSPMLSAVSTKAELQTISDGKSIYNDKSRWHLGAGGNVQVSYAVTDHLNIGLYSGITYLTGKGMDGVTKHVHDANYLWESGLRIGWSFGKKQKKAPVVPDAAPEPAPQVVEKPAKPEPIVVEPEPEPKREIYVPEVKELTFPEIYFDFNKSAIRASETEKVQAIYDALQANPDVEVLVTGWCSNSGSRKVNDALSLRRAKAVKDRLVKMGIDESRIEVSGNGIDYNEPNATKARRVVVTDRKEGQK
ncbi:MAG: OmpA family protein [Candidatus Limisoma sp.]